MHLSSIRTIFMPRKIHHTPKPTKLVARKERPAKSIPLILDTAKDALKIAFIGRSNVGKSSLINYLLDHHIAKTSKHPGKTREHQAYRYSPNISLVDMPGYGYAIIRKERRQQWDQDLLRLFFDDQHLAHVFVLIDISIKPMNIDQDFIAWLLEHDIPHTVVYTKADKAKQQEKNKNLTDWKLYLAGLQHPYPLATFEVSALKRKGGGELKAFINQIKRGE
jgi:GTP-binding protein